VSVIQFPRRQRRGLIGNFFVMPPAWRRQRVIVMCKTMSPTMVSSMCGLTMDELFSALFDP